MSKEWPHKVSFSRMKDGVRKLRDVEVSLHKNTAMPAKLGASFREH